MIKLLILRVTEIDDTSRIIPAWTLGGREKEGRKKERERKMDR